MAQVIFTLNGINTTIQCLKKDKKQLICNKFVSKIDSNINSMIFLYGGKEIDMNLTYKELLGSLDMNKMNILVYKKENNTLICSKCGAKINFDLNIFNDLLLSNTNKNGILIGLKSQIENIINDIIIDKNNNYITNQLKNINIMIENIRKEKKENDKQIKDIMNEFKENKIKRKIENEINIGMRDMSMNMNIPMNMGMREMPINMNIPMNKGMGENQINMDTSKNMGKEVMPINMNIPMNKGFTNINQMPIIDEDWLEGCKMGFDEINDYYSKVPKKNIFFYNGMGTSLNLALKHETTISQALERYLYSIGKPELFGTKIYLFYLMQIN